MPTFLNTEAEMLDELADLDNRIDSLTARLGEYAGRPDRDCPYDVERARTQKSMMRSYRGILESRLKELLRYTT